MGYVCQLYSIASAGRLKKQNSIHREGIRIYTGAFRTLSVEVLHVEANDPPMELRFLCKLKTNTSYIETQIYWTIERTKIMKKMIGH